MTTTLRPPANPAGSPEGLGSPMDRRTAEQFARLLKAVADPARLQLLALIRASQDCQACVCDLTAGVGLSQPTVSHHLKTLVDAGLLTRQKRGYWTWYSLVPDRMAQIAAVLA